MPCVVVYKIRRQRTFMLTAGPTTIEECVVRVTASEVLLERQRPRAPTTPLPPLEWVIARYERAPWMFGRVVAKWPV